MFWKFALHKFLFGKVDKYSGHDKFSVGSGDVRWTNEQQWEMPKKMKKKIICLQMTIIL